MSVEVLRRAAALMREDYADVQGADEHFVLAVADWLEWVTEPIDAYILPPDAPLYIRALAVATAYLGESSCGS